MNVILNNRLSWDGSYLGSYIGSITYKNIIEGIRYYGITLPQNWTENLNLTDKHPGGIIYCTAKCTKDKLPCIIDDIRTIFGIARRGNHRVTIDGRDYIIYHLPISIARDVVWDVPLNKIDSKHELRKDPTFRKEIQKIIAFCYILSLPINGEQSIRIRAGVKNDVFPINVNESITKVEKISSDTVSKTMFSRWFGEETSLGDIIREIATCRTTMLSKDPASILADIRNKINEIIERYDNGYIWFSNLVIGRLACYLIDDV